MKVENEREKGFKEIYNIARKQRQKVFEYTNALPITSSSVNSTFHLTLHPTLQHADLVMPLPLTFKASFPISRIHNLVLLYL